MKAEYSISKITPDGQEVRVYTLTPCGQKLDSFLPGQFAKLALKKNGTTSISRPYSIASAPSPDGILEFCIKMEKGQLTSLLEKACVGDVIEVDGPYGHFAYSESKKTVLLAGGTGIAPMMSMARYIRNKEIKGEVVLIYSNKTEKDILYRKELETFKQKGFIIVHTLTREEEGSPWKGERGRISKELVEKYVKDPQNSSWYFCGPLQMVTAFKQIALELGADPKKIKLEGWG